MTTDVRRIVLRVSRVSAFLVILAVVALAAWVGDFKVTPDEENVVASRLVGTWVWDEALNARLKPYGKARERMTFASDPSIATRIPATYKEHLEGRQIYLAGTRTRGESVSPFILIEHRGNPMLVYFRERDGDPMGDAEFSLVCIAPAMDPANDLLFVGGDFNNEPFHAFSRLREEPK